jgi:hypothetical protein
LAEVSVVAGSVRSRVALAAGLHRQAAATAAAAEQALDGHAPHQRQDAEQRDLAERLRALAAELAPGWLGLPLRPAAASHPLGAHDTPRFVRVGTAQPLDDTVFPVVVPLLEAGHLTIDADARDPRVAGALRALLLRLLAATPAGQLLVRVVDAGGGQLFAGFAPLADPGLMPPPVTDRPGLRWVLAEAEQWVRANAPPARPRNRKRLLLLVVASLPELTDGGDLARLAALAQSGPAAGLHLVVAGWPPPPLTAETTQERLPFATAIAVRNPYAVVAGPPDAALGQDTPLLNAPVFLDDDPPAELVERVSRELAAQAAIASQIRLADIIPDEPLWTADAGRELATVVGLAGDTPVTLRFNEITPHWLVGGRPAVGRTAFLLNVLFGLCARYGPDQLTGYLLDLTGSGSVETVVAELPQLRAVAVAPDREYGLAVLGELDAELARRVAEPGRKVPRILCVIDEFPVLLSGGDAVAGEAVERLASLARTGRSHGIHLVLASKAAAAALDPIANQFPVRVALPGGDHVLDPANDSATGLPLGAAVVNTASGLGGPRGATRGHEKTVRFPDPYADADALAELRDRLRDGTVRPHVFVGTATHHLPDEPHDPPTVLMGRRLDVELTTLAHPLDRNLAVLGPSGTGADVLDSAARSLAAQYPPGAVRFLLAPLAPGTNRSAAETGAALSDAGHAAVLVDASALPGTLTELGQPGVPSYLLIFGADALSPPADALRAALRDGPALGHHVLAWWRGVGRFRADAAGDAMSGLVFLNVPGAEAALVVGRPVEWSPRPNRALFHDVRTGETTVFIPFSRQR